MAKKINCNVNETVDYCVKEGTKLVNLLCSHNTLKGYIKAFNDDTLESEEGRTISVSKQKNVSGDTDVRIEYRLKRAVGRKTAEDNNYLVFNTATQDKVLKNMKIFQNRIDHVLRVNTPKLIIRADVGPEYTKGTITVTTTTAWSSAEYLEVILDYYSNQNTTYIEKLKYESDTNLKNVIFIHSLTGDLIPLPKNTLVNGHVTLGFNSNRYTYRYDAASNVDGTVKTKSKSKIKKAFDELGIPNPNDLNEDDCFMLNIKIGKK